MTDVHPSHHPLGILPARYFSRSFVCGITRYPQCFFKIIFVILFPDVYRKVKPLLTSTMPLLITSLMEMDMERGEPYLRAEKVVPVERYNPSSLLAKPLLYLIYANESLVERQSNQDLFYTSLDWKPLLPRPEVRQFILDLTGILDNLKSPPV